MNSRERIKKALAFKEADRIPVDNNGNVSGMHEVAYRKLLDYLKIEDEVIIYDYVQRLAIVNDKVKEILGVDTRYIYPKAPERFPFEIKSDGTFKDEFGTEYKRVNYYADVKTAPLKGLSLFEIKSFRFPDPMDPSRFYGLKEETKKLFEQTSYSLWAGLVSSIFYQAWCLRGLEDFMTDIYAEPKIAEYLMDKIVDWHLNFFEIFYAEIGSFIDVFWIGDDWGTQNGPLISPVYFRKEVVPRFKKMISFIKTKTSALCCYHTCGSTCWCMDDLIEMGVDIVHPLQANAFENDTAKIKQKYGNRLSFHGGTNNQGVFHKDIHTLTIDTLRRIKDIAPGGGYIFSSGHNIQANMPPENIVRFFDIAKHYGSYPIDMDKIDNRIETEKQLMTGD